MPLQTPLQIQATPTFMKAVKRLLPRDKKVVDGIIAALALDLGLGEEKKGDLAGVFVTKFKINKQEVLLSYSVQPSKFAPQSLVLLSLGSHENFYAKLKQQER
jgi:hypothetical protein